jgi:hypothetical protein
MNSDDIDGPQAVSAWTGHKRECRRIQSITLYYIQNVPGGKVNILRGHSIGHSKQKNCNCACPIPNGFRDRVISPYVYSWLRHYATSRKIAGSSPNEVTGCFSIDIRLTGGGEVVSLRRLPPFTPPPPREDSWYSFLLEAGSTPGP